MVGVEKFNLLIQGFSFSRNGNAFRCLLGQYGR